jgi:UDP-4-amino-4,6-dideoxy-N-acetyl-beta-L-altrosamine transaminase
MSKQNIPYSKQNIIKKDIDLVNNVLKSEYLTSGPLIQRFEKKISRKVNSKFSVAANSATSALHISCLALGLKKKDIVWTSSITFVASANCAKYCGAKIEFLDINDDTFNLDVDKLEQKLRFSKKTNTLPKVLIPVHLGGNPCDMKKIYFLSKKYKFKIIEDASHALGGKINNSKIGSCKYSNLTVFSFHPVKMITTAEGGVVTTNDKILANKLKKFREHGIEREKKNFVFKQNLETYYEQQVLGYNYRMSDLNASLGISQLDRLKHFVKKRNFIANYYKNNLKNLPITFQKINKNNICSYHLVIIRVRKNLRNKLFNHLRNKNIKVNVHYIPVFFHPYYYKKKYLINKSSINYYETAISLPAFFDLKLNDLRRIIQVLKFFFKVND